MRSILKRVPPLLTLLLLAIWLTLAGSLSFAQIALGAVLSVAFILAVAQLRPVRPSVHRLYLAMPLVGIVLVDILRSNFSVAAIVLGLARGSQVHSGFLHIPLELRDPHGLTLLAVMVTSTPGTSWAGVSADGATLTLHVLDLKDEEEMIQFIKRRYEQPLLRIFQ